MCGLQLVESGMQGHYFFFNEDRIILFIVPMSIFQLIISIIFLDQKLIL